MTRFCVQTKPNSATIAVRNLTRQGFETFLPKERATTRQKTGFRTRVRPLFPGYVFVALDVKRGGWRSVNSAYGVSRIVSFGDQPAVVPDDLIEGIRGLCREEDALRTLHDLQPGNTAVLADAHLENGEVATGTGSPAHIYVLRASPGSQDFASVTAHHLDATNAVNFIMATQLELRSSDVVFVAEQPVTSWNRVLQQVLPTFTFGRSLASG